MKIFVLFAALVMPIAALAAVAPNPTPEWAFPDRDASPQPPADAPPVPAANAAARLPPDAAAPSIVREGKGQTVRACHDCHWGSSEPQMGNISGLPVAYFMQTMADFKSEARKGLRAPTMIALAKELSDDENKALAEYYAAQKATPWIKVIESTTAPKTFIGGNNTRRLWPLGGEEPVGERVIEYAIDFPTMRAANSQGFVAYVPPGSVAEGQALVTTGGGKAIACGTCHGGTLTGLGNVPPIAGRSPVYLARQLYMYKNGDRGGPNAEIMKGIVANLQDHDIVAIVAYLASRPPS